MLTRYLKILSPPGTYDQFRGTLDSSLISSLNYNSTSYVTSYELNKASNIFTFLNNNKTESFVAYKAVGIKASTKYFLNATLFDLILGTNINFTTDFFNDLSIGINVEEYNSSNVLVGTTSISSFDFLNQNKRRTFTTTSTTSYFLVKFFAKNVPANSTITFTKLNLAEVLVDKMPALSVYPRAYDKQLDFSKSLLTNNLDVQHSVSGSVLNKSTGVASCTVLSTDIINAYTQWNTNGMLPNTTYTLTAELEDYPINVDISKSTVYLGFVENEYNGPAVSRRINFSITDKRLNMEITTSSVYTNGHFRLGVVGDVTDVGLYKFKNLGVFLKSDYDNFPIDDNAPVAVEDPFNDAIVTEEHDGTLIDLTEIKQVDTIRLSTLSVDNMLEYAVLASIDGYSWRLVWRTDLFNYQSEESYIIDTSSMDMVTQPVWKVVYPDITNTNVINMLTNDRYLLATLKADWTLNTSMTVPAFDGDEPIIPYEKTWYDLQTENVIVSDFDEPPPVIIDSGEFEPLDVNGIGFDTNEVESKDTGVFEALDVTIITLVKPPSPLTDGAKIDLTTSMFINITKPEIELAEFRSDWSLNSAIAFDTDESELSQEVHDLALRETCSFTFDETPKRPNYLDLCQQMIISNDKNDEIEIISEPPENEYTEIELPPLPSTEPDEPNMIYTPNLEPVPSLPITDYHKEPVHNPLVHTFNLTTVDTSFSYNAEFYQQFIDNKDGSFGMNCIPKLVKIHHEIVEHNELIDAYSKDEVFRNYGETIYDDIKNVRVFKQKGKGVLLVNGYPFMTTNKEIKGDDN